MLDVGTDVKNTLEFRNGDIVTVSGTENIGQAVLNRLNTYWGDLDLFYPQYGSRVADHFGDFNIATIHEYIRIDVEDALSKDPRFKEVHCECSKSARGKVNCTVNILLYNETEVTIYLVITENNKINLLNEVMNYGTNE